MRTVLPKKDEDYGKKLTSDRILVENYFGRMVNWLHIFSAKLICSNSLNGNIFVLGIIFTNFHIVMHKLLDDDKFWYNCYRV